MDIQIIKEADASELRQVIAEMANSDSDNFLTNTDIKDTLSLLPSAIGYWLRNSTPREDGSFRGEMSGGLIVVAVPKPAGEGIAFGRPYSFEDHYEVYVKFEGKALEAIESEMGKPVKNG